MKELLELSVEKLEKLLPVKKAIEEKNKLKARLISQVEALDHEIDKLVSQVSAVFTSKEAAAPKAAKPARRKARKKAGGRKKARAKKKVAAKKGARSSKKKATQQPSISALVQEVLAEAKGPVSVKEIGETLLNEKGYKTKSKNFSNQLRVLLYQNKKGTFKKPEEACLF